MAILGKTPPFATVIEGESMTEQEHLDSCDINKMIHAVHRGQMIRGGKPPQYGYDDTTMDGVTHRIKKEQVEKELSTIARENEFTQEELDKIPENVQKRFKFKKKALNDDKTTNNGLPSKEPKPQEPSPPSEPPKTP